MEFGGDCLTMAQINAKSDNDDIIQQLADNLSEQSLKADSNSDEQLVVCDDNQSNKQSSDRSDVSTQLIAIKSDTDAHADTSQSSESQRLAQLLESERWGECFNVVDIATGKRKKVIDLDEISNYMKLDIEDHDLDFYVALVNNRYPRFFRCTPQFNQRWRMRYNIFVGSLFDDMPNSVLFYGEIHLYFDIISRLSHPCYVNSSIYKNKTIVSEITINEGLMNRMDRAIHDYRFSKDIHQLKFPFKPHVFTNTDSIFDKFMERQTEFDEDAQLLHYKYTERAKKFGYNNRAGRQRRTNSRPMQYRRRSDSHNENDVQFEDTKQRIDFNGTKQSGNYRFNGMNRFDRNRRYSNRFNENNANQQNTYQNSGRIRYSFNEQKTGEKYDSFRNNENRIQRNDRTTTYRRRDDSRRNDRSGRSDPYFGNAINCGQNSE